MGQGVAGRGIGSGHPDRFLRFLCSGLLSNRRERFLFTGDDEVLLAALKNDTPDSQRSAIKGLETAARDTAKVISINDKQTL